MFAKRTNKAEISHARDLRSKPLNNKPMKKTLLFSILALLVASMVHSQSCNSFFPTAKGTVMEYINYDKGVKTSATLNEITDVQIQGETTLITISSVTQAAEKGKDEEVTIEHDYTYECSGDVIKIDMKSFLDLSQYKDMEMSVNANNLGYPAQLSVGQTLENANVIAVISNAGMKIATLSVDITERKVVAQESITVKGGTFECYKITQNTNSKFGMIKVAGTSAEWVSQGIGVVKSESYNKKGAVTTSTELKSIVKP